MNDAEITQKLDTLVGEFGEVRRNYAALLEDSDKGEGIVTIERRALLAVAAGKFDLLKNESARMFAEAIPKPTVAEKEKIVEMELGEKGHQKAVYEFRLRLLEKELKVLETATIHAASLRKGERF